MLGHTYQTLDTYLETEKFITAEEYMLRYNRGEIDPADVRNASGDPATGYVGGFIVKLKQPRYRVDIQPVMKSFPYAG